MFNRAGSVLRSPRSLAAAVVLLGCVGLRFAFLGGGVDHSVVVDFADADGLVNGNEVRIAGVNAGTVSDIRIVHNRAAGALKGVNQYAEVVVHIDDAHWPLHAGTQFAVRPRGVLSNVFVALTPGPANGGQLDTSSPIPVSRTTSPINIDELSNVFDPSVRDSIKTQIAQGNIMFGGDGAQNGALNLNGTLHNLNPLSADLVPLTATLAQRSPELDRLNTEYDTILGELAREDTSLRGVIEHGNVLFKAIVDKQVDLQGTLDHAASSLTKLDGVLQGEQSNVIAIFQKGPTNLDKTVSTNQLLLPLLTAVNPHIPHLDQLLHFFVTGNGYVAQSAGGPQVDNLRVNGSLPLSGRTASPCGGEPIEQPNCQATFSSSAADGSAGPTLASGTVAAPLTAVLGGMLG